jgi:hypothetical protein
MKQNHFRFVLVTSLVASSAALFFVQYVVYRDLRDTFFYMLQDIAFLPLQVLIVTLVLERILRSREKQERLNKQNMVIGTFFSQAGVALLKQFATWDPGIEIVRENLLIKKTCSDEEFESLHSRLATYKSGMQPAKVDFDALKKRITTERDFLLGLLENQNLLEHEQFTDLLWATFHLLEELTYRQEFSHLPKSDLDHLVGDINRVYTLLICQWIMYMQHLKKNYPYLFSLAMRTNPFDAAARIEVE